jgi:hypothetical protein
MNVNLQLLFDSDGDLLKINDKRTGAQGHFRPTAMIGKMELNG